MFYFKYHFNLLAFAGGIYLFFGNTKTNTSSSAKKLNQFFSSSQTEKQKLKPKLLPPAAQANPSAEAVTNAQATINKISLMKLRKQIFQSQLDAVSAGNKSNKC